MPMSPAATHVLKYPRAGLRTHEHLPLAPSHAMHSGIY